MRKSREETVATRARIVEAASSEFRRNGIDGTGLDDLMAAAGLTRGGFYRHFESKNQLVAEACSVAAQRQIDGISLALRGKRRSSGLRSVANFYLDQSRRDDPTISCPLAMLGSELARCDSATRSSATDSFSKLVDIIFSQIDSEDSEKARSKAVVIATTLIGALTVAHFINHSSLSDQVLETVKQACASA